jgi:hypothetical protein
MKLTKHEQMSARIGPVYGTGEVFQYRVGGPTTRPGGSPERILRLLLSAEFCTLVLADDALAALQKEFEQ